MNFIKLQILVLVSEKKRITEVANILNIKQPTVTFHMKSLEESLGVKLFEYSSGFINLTECGEILLHYSKNIILLLEEANNSIKDYKELKCGTLKIGTSYVPSAYLLPSIIKTLNTSDRCFNTKITVKNSTEIVKLVLENKLDLGIVSTGLLQNESLLYKKFYKDELVLVFSANNVLKNLESLDKKTIESMNFISHSPSSSTGETVMNYVNKHSINLNILVEIDSIEAIKTMILEDNNISIISKSAIKKEVELGLLSYHHLPIERLFRDFYIIYNKSKWISPLMSEFLNITL